MGAIARGVKRRGAKVLLLLPTGVALTWGVLEPLQAVVPGLVTIPIVGGIFAAAVVIALISVRDLSQIEIEWDQLNTYVTIKVGDLMEHPGPIVVSFDDLFLTEHEKLVNSQSIVGQLVEKKFGGDASALAAALEAKLALVAAEDVVLDGKQRKRYPVGTAVSHATAPRFHGVAFCHIDEVQVVGDATSEHLWAGLEGTWRALHNHRFSLPVGVPLLGAGQTALGLNPTAHLNVMLVSLMASVRQRPIVDPVVIYLHESIKDQVDLRAIQATWASVA